MNVKLICIIIISICVSTAWSQTATTGAFTGITTDPSGAVVPGVEVTVKNETTGEARSALSGETGNYVIPLLLPGSYRVQASIPGFKLAVHSGIRINVTETTRLNIQLAVGEVTDTVSVEATPVMVQQETSALGRVVGQVVVESLPLVTRNYTQILALSPGMTMDVTNAAELGRGSGSQVIGRTYAHGSRAYDNNFQIDGVDSNDFEASAGGNTAGTAVPNPDAIQEFKVQTGQYDAAYGRNAGANVNIVTKSGSNDIHATLFHFFRNEALNANDFFFNKSGTKKPVLRQNQFGGTFSGPIKKEKVLFFGSYQGTRQANGLAAGKTRSKCSSSVFSPPLTDDRSPAALGAMFAGRRGQQGGTAILPDGSNINSIALRLLQLKLPNGSYMIPSPQVIDRSQPFDRQGFSTTSIPCSFAEDQFMTNVDFLHTDKSKLAGRFFYAASDQFVPFPTAGANTPGSPVTVGNKFHVTSLSHSYVLTPRLFNEARLGFYRNWLELKQSTAFSYSGIGVLSGGDPKTSFDDIPSVGITGSFNMTACCPLDLPQRNYVYEDHVSYIRGIHSLRTGAGVTRVSTDVNKWRSNGSLTFQSFPDFLLGMDGVSNGSGFSNVFSSSYGVGPGLWRQFRIWNGFVYVQDDIKLKPNFTLNAGFRYERLGHPDDKLGVSTNFDISKADPSPPVSGTLAGWIVPSNYAGSDLPPGVGKVNNGFGVNGDGPNTWGPRLGFAWQVLPKSSRMVVRGGYGIYYTRTVGQTNYNATSSGPFRVSGSRSGSTNAAATFANPFVQPVPATFPIWTPLYYSPASALSTSALAMNFRPPLTVQYGLNLQAEVARDFLLEIGYLGTRATRLTRPRSLNQARLAGAANPIRGLTTNTVANVRQRVPYLGWQATGITTVESEGESWYNALQASLTKRMSHGMQFLASYTWSKSLDTDAANTFNAHIPGLAVGDQNNPRQRFGRTEFDRAHRFVLSYVYEIPGIASQNRAIKGLFKGWAISGVTTIQTGQALTVTYTNANNVFGITSDRAQIVPGCTTDNMLTSGRLQGRLSNYFNSRCFSAPLVIGDDGRATAFGNSGVGIVDGPGQKNFDVAVIKRTPLGRGESSRLEFRVEFFNALNKPQFDSPVTNFSSAAFGQISSTSVNPRILQLALKLTF